MSVFMSDRWGWVRGNRQSSCQEPDIHPFCVNMQCMHSDSNLVTGFLQQADFFHLRLIRNLVSVNQKRQTYISTTTPVFCFICVQPVIYEWDVIDSWPFNIAGNGENQALPLGIRFTGQIYWHTFLHLNLTWSSGMWKQKKFSWFRRNFAT